MTSVVFLKDRSSCFVGFTMKGHSGYADEGDDIVCAGLSSCCEMVLSQLIDCFGYDVDVTIYQKTAAVGCDSRRCGTVKESRETISKIIDGFYRTVSDIEKQYPRFVKCSITEV